MIKIKSLVMNKYNLLTLDIRLVRYNLLSLLFKNFNQALNMVYIHIMNTIKILLIQYIKIYVWFYFK